MSIGDIVIILFLVLIMGFSVRQVVRGRKGGGCPGCGSCSACSEACASKDTDNNIKPGTEETEQAKAMN